MSKCPVSLRDIALATFRPFDKGDWECYAGCESETPLMANINDADVILDSSPSLGETIVVYAFTPEGETVDWEFQLKEIR